MADADPIPTTRISRSLVGRLIAVGLFLVVGTVAVIHTVNRRVPQPTELAANASKSEPGDEAKTESVAQSVEHAPATSLPPPAMNTSGGTSSLKVAVTGGEETETGDYPPRIAASGINAGAGKPPVLGQATLQATRQATNATGAATPLNPLVHSTTSQEPPGSLQEPGGAPDKQPPPIVRGSITVEPETEAPGEPSNLATTGSAAPRAFPTPPAILSGSGARPPATGGSTSMALGDAPPLVAGKTASPPASLTVGSNADAGANPLAGLGSNRPETTGTEDGMKSALSSSPDPLNPTRTSESGPPPAKLTPYDTAPPIVNSSTLLGNSGKTPSLAPKLPAADDRGESDTIAQPADISGGSSTAVPEAANAANLAPLRESAPTQSAPSASWPNDAARNAGESTRTPTFAAQGDYAKPPTTPGLNTSFGRPEPLAPSAATGLSPQRSLGASQPALMAPPIVSAARPVPGDSVLQGPQNPALKIQKVAPSEVQIGQVADFQIVLQNDSNTAIPGIVVHDRVPEGATLIASEPKAETLGDGTLVWNIPALAANQSTTIQLKLRPDRPGHFGSVAQVTFSALATATTRCTKPVLELQVDSQPQALIGDDVAFNITIRNTGDGPAQNVYLQEAVPSGLEFASGLSQIEYDIGTLAPGDQRQVQLTLKAAKVGMAVNRIVALGDGDLQTTDETELLVVAPDLRASGDGPSRKYLQREATYQFAVTNQGTARATNLNLVAALPPGLQFVEANNYGQYDAQSHSVYWSMPDLAASLVGKVELVALPVQPGKQSIDFRVTADLQQQAATQVDTEVQSIVEVACEIDDVEDPIEIDRQTVYNIRVVNEGNQPATQVRLVVDFPTGLMPLQVGGGLRSQIQGQRVVFEAIPRLDANQETVISITARGVSAGDHRVVASLATDGRETPISKEESTRVYSDRD